MLTAIKKTKEREAEEGLADVVEQGWLIKEGPNDSRRKRYNVYNLYILSTGVRLSYKYTLSIEFTFYHAGPLG
jgi:hypothetical protein